MTIKEAKKMVMENRDNTAWYGENNINLLGENVATKENLYNLFRYRFNMGEAETMCLIGALVISGAIIEG